MLGNLNSQNIESILENKYLKEIRKSIAQGIPHEYCSNCVNAEAQGGQSERNWHNNLNPAFDYSQAGDEFQFLTLVDVRWNNTCNLSCNYCGSSSSSVWAALEGIPFKSGARPYYTQVCDFVEKHYEHIKEVALVGGEPLLLPENIRLLDVIPPEALVTVITNLSVDIDTNKIFKKLAERPRVGWSISFDNIGEQFEYVRHGAKWDTMQKNLQTIKQLFKQGHHGGIHAVYSIYNSTNLCELVEFARENEFTIHWQTLFWPDHLSPFLQDLSIIDLAIAEIEKLYQRNLATESDRAFFDSTLETYRKITNANPTISEKFKNHINQIESIYHPDSLGQFARLWPEIFKELSRTTNVK